MSRLRASAFAVATLALILGLCVSPLQAQDTDDAPPPPPPRRRLPARPTRPVRPVRPVAAEDEEGQPRNAADADAQPPEGEAEAPRRQIPRLPRNNRQDPEAQPGEGEAGEAGQPQPKLQRAPAPVMRLSPVTADMLAVLEAWEKQSSQIQKLYGGIQRFTYDSVFMVQKTAVGTFYYSAPDRGAFRVEGAKLAANAQIKKNAQGQPFNPKPDDPEHWICTGKDIFKFDHNQKMYEYFLIPPEDRGAAIMDTPLPFLLGMKVNQARLRYKMTLAKNSPEGTYMIDVVPRMQKDIANYRSATVLLNKETFLPVAVRLIDPTGNKETVLRFTKVVQNEDPKAGGFLGIGGGAIDPTDPRPYAKYKRAELQDHGTKPQARRDAKDSIDGLGAADRR